MNKLQQTLYLCKNYKFKSICKRLISYMISDTVVISFQKTGKTWLRLLYAKSLQEEFGLREIKLDTEFMTFGKKMKNVMFSHAGTTKENNKFNFQNLFRNKKIVFLARDPRAILTSRYHDYTKRVHTYSGTLHEFVYNQNYGIETIIGDFNSWAPSLSKKSNKICLIRYEDMIADTEKEFKRFLNFIGTRISDESIKKAIEYTKPSNMRKLEQKNVFMDPRMQVGNLNEQNSYKIRKAKIDSFKEELTEEDLDYVTKAVAGQLNPLFKYNSML